MLEQAKDAYFDDIVTVINSLKIPDIEDSKGNYMKGNSFVMDERTDNVLIYPDVANNALVMRCDKLSGVFYNNEFRYKEWPFVAKGHSDVIISTILVQFGLSFGTTNQNGRTLPYITGVDIDVDINRFDINIQIWGNIWSDFASLLEVFFVGTVADMIDDAITAGLQTGIPLVANHLIKSTDGYFPIPPYANWKLDWETEFKPDVTNTFFDVGVKGNFFDGALTETEPTVNIPVMPYWDTNRPQQFQAYVSSYTVDSFFSSWLQVGAIGGWFNSTMVPANATVQLDTTTVDELMPGLADYYGQHLPMDIHFKVLGVGNIGIYEENQEMDGEVTLETQWWVNQADGTRVMAAQVTLKNSVFGFTAIVTNMDVSL